MEELSYWQQPTWAPLLTSNLPRADLCEWNWSGARHSLANGARQELVRLIRTFVPIVVGGGVYHWETSISG